MLIQSHGIVLAGGRSLRMGQTKALLQFQGKTLLDRAVELLESVCQSVIISGPYSVRGYPSIEDVFLQKGPLGGIASVLRSDFVSTGNSSLKFIFIPVDMPFLTQRELRLLVDQSACWTSFKGHELPFCFKNSQKVLLQIEKLFTEPLAKGSIEELRKKMGGIEIELSEHAGNQSLNRAMINLNTPQDLELLK